MKSETRIAKLEALRMNHQNEIRALKGMVRILVGKLGKIRDMTRV